MTAAGSKRVHVFSQSQFSCGVAMMALGSYARPEAILWSPEWNRNVVVSLLTLQSSNVCVTGIACFHWAMPPTCFLGGLLHLQMLLSPAWMSTFSYGLKFYQELQAGRRISYVLVSTTGPMSVDNRGRVGGGVISPWTRWRLMLTGPRCPHLSSYNEYRWAWQGSLYWILWKFLFWACWRTRIWREGGKDGGCSAVFHGCTQNGHHQTVQQPEALWGLPG